MKSAFYSRSIYYCAILVYHCPPQVLDGFYSQHTALCLKIITLSCFKDKFHIVLFLTASTVHLTNGNQISKMDHMDFLLQKGKGMVEDCPDVWREQTKFSMSHPASVE